MTSRERVLMALKREGIPDRMPFEISWGAFTPSLIKVYQEKTGSQMSPDEYYDFDVRAVQVGPSKKKTNFCKYFAEPLPDDVMFDEFGIGTVRGSMEHFVEIKYHPLAEAETVEEILEYNWPDLDADYRYLGLKEKVTSLKQRGYAVAADMYTTVFEMAWQMRGMEQLCIDFYESPEMAHAILECLTQLRVKQAEKYAEIGVDIIRLGDDIATQRGPLMSPEIYEEFFLERMKRIVRAGKRINPQVLYFLHSDGKVESMIPKFIEEGIDILNPVQPECNNLRKIAELYGDKIAFWGGIGTQSTMPFGTPEEVKEKVKEIQTILGKNGAVLVAPSHILEPEVQWENVEAFIEAAKTSYY